MAINDIITTIEEESNAKITEMRKEAEEERNKLSTDYDKQILKNEADFINGIKKKIDLKVKKQKFILNNGDNKKLLEKKWDMINNIYKKVLAELSDMEESPSRRNSASDRSSQDGQAEADKKEKIIKKWMQNCPKEGKIANSERGGFIFQSDKIRIDNTFENVIRGLREETEVEVGKILFS